MEVIHNNQRISCSTTEYAELVRLGVFGDNYRPAPADLNTPLMNGEQHDARTDNLESEESAVSNNSPEVDGGVFFDDMSSLTAKFLLALVRSDGVIDQSTLLRELNLESGRSLRRPVGSAHKRIREASSGQITSICSVTEPDGDQQERIYRSNGHTLEFLREHTGKLEELAQGE
ncbi:hypothetical protein [Tautonia plasticadhaerens]|uniref:hypothetical protein n=1 Tax=Tautonia plasticadhaerens TaxID=2527974 RepID=UPI0011A69521|nr:hypothetical protein [Tautonia plasticadhaerens]